MRIGVTGGGGLLGRAVVERLLSRDHIPVVIDLSARPGDAADAEWRTADVRDLDALTNAFTGLDAVIHLASLIDLHLGEPRSLHEVNVVGARNAVAACRANNIARLVHMSSAEVITGTEPLRGITEEDSAYPSPHLTYYGVTKQAGEQEVLGAADHAIGTCAMRSYGLFGVGDNTVVPMYLSTLPGRSIVMMGDLESRTDVVFAANLAHCMVLAAEQIEPGLDWSGTPFHVTDHEPVNIQRFLADLVAPLGYRSIERFRIPRSAVAAMASFYEARYRATKLERFARPPLTHHRLKLALDDYWLNSTKATVVLGFRPPFSRDEAIGRTREWLITQMR